MENEPPPGSLGEMDGGQDYGVGGGGGGFEDEPPLLEELGIDFELIRLKVIEYRHWLDLWFTALLLFPSLSLFPFLSFSSLFLSPSQISPSSLYRL